MIPVQRGDGVEDRGRGGPPLERGEQPGDDRGERRRLVDRVGVGGPARCPVAAAVDERGDAVDDVADAVGEILVRPARPAGPVKSVSATAAVSRANHQRTRSVP